MSVAPRRLFVARSATMRTRYGAKTACSAFADKTKIVYRARRQLMGSRLNGASDYIGARSRREGSLLEKGRKTIGLCLIAVDDREFADAASRGANLRGSGATKGLRNSAWLGRSQRDRERERETETRELETMTAPGRDLSIARRTHATRLHAHPRLFLRPYLYSRVQASRIRELPLLAPLR